MSSIKIIKTINLGFLGERYKDAYIEFASIPVKDYQALQDEIKANTGDSVNFILKVLEKKFVGGKFPGDDGKLTDLTTENIGELDGEAVVKIFGTLTGQISPKV